MKNISLVIPDMPFCLGAMVSPENPVGLPSTYPFCLELNYVLGRLEQATDSSLEDLLGKAYLVGNEMGTPSNHTELGLPYVKDFMRFIDQSAPIRGTLLEIGAGTGFMSKCLAEAGWQVTSIEPGVGYQRHWDAYGVHVINDFFPSDHVQGQYDVIVFYTVLEHIKDTKSFLNSVKKQLKPTGQILLAVPDCTIEISECDPSILLHEHFHYFTSASLANTLSEAGIASVVEKGQFGRSLFAMGSITSDQSTPSVSAASIRDNEAYIANIPKVRANLQDELARWLKSGNVGMYCPSRLLNIVPVGLKFAFYDDAKEIQGRFYPPFTSAVRSREALLADSPTTLLIGSRTFGGQLKEQLIAAGLQSNIVLLGELT